MCRIPKLGIICPKRLLMNFIVGINVMSCIKCSAGDIDMMFIPTTGL